MSLLFRRCAMALLLLSGVALGEKLKLAHLKASANPPKYAAFTKPLSKDERLEHAVSRLTFGARAGDVAEVRRLGLARWIDLELHPEGVPENAALLQHLAALPTLNVAAPPDPKDRARQKAVAAELADAKLLRAIYSDHQLEELLVDFWYNHFNVFLDKGQDRFLTAAYEREAIRPHMLGKFFDLLLATARSPAMLFYLDNWQSAAPDSPAANRPNAKRKRGLNENYGRELLELHTLGVEGGYTQQDVVEVARCFTGWTIRRPADGGQFQYNDRMHDQGAKLVLGHSIPAGGGENDGLEVLHMLAASPATARFLSYELAQRFVADDPPPSLVARLSATYLRSDGDLREVMNTLLHSPEFWSQGAYRAKIKTPFELVAAAARATNANVTSADALGFELQKLGEPLYRKAEPTGYSNKNSDWLGSAELLERMNFAVALSKNRIPGVQVAAADWQRLGAPEFQRK